MTDVIEKMARASYAAYMDGLVGCCEDRWDDMPQHHRERLMNAERAALAAALEDMETPSEAVINCGGVAIWDSSPADFHDLSRDACRSAAIPGWQAMLAQYRKENLGDE